MKESLISVEQERENMQNQVEREQDFYRMLKQTFPSETILTSRVSIRTVPITPGLDGWPDQFLPEFSPYTQSAQDETVRLSQM